MPVDSIITEIFSNFRLLILLSKIEKSLIE